MRKILIASLAVAGLGLVTSGAMARPGKGPGPGLFQMDADGDGAISAAEMDAHNADLMANADTDRDGLLTREEFDAYRRKKRDEFREKTNPDKNRDGVVSLAEHLAAAEERFARLDTNGDGVLSEDERRPRRFLHARHGEDN